MTDPALAIAVPLIAGFEGFRSEPYKDIGGTWTYGFGFTTTSDGHYVSATTPPITLEAATARLTPMVASVMALVRGMIYVYVTNNEVAALTSFAYNEGTNALRLSTLLMRLNAGDSWDAANCLLSWVYVAGQPSDGLRDRRARERELFLEPDAKPEPDITDTSTLTADDLNAEVLDGTLDLE